MKLFFIPSLFLLVTLNSSCAHSCSQMGNCSLSSSDSALKEQHGGNAENEAWKQYDEERSRKKKSPKEVEKELKNWGRADSI